jgi:hypothetical protein
VWADSKSIPLPIYMEKKLNAGRETYDKQSTPTQLDGIPTIVNLSMYIEGISSFRTQTMDFQLDVYFQQYWYDFDLAEIDRIFNVIRCKHIFKRLGVILDLYTTRPVEY